MVKTNEKTDLKVKDIISNLKHAKLPLIHEDSDLKEVINIMTQVSNDRMHYVVDRDNRLLGTISLNELIRHIFSHSHEPKIHPRRLMDMVTSETAKHIMKRTPISAAEDDNIETVLNMMVKHNVKQIALLDKDGKVIHDITMLDLLREWLEQESLM
jgi:CBS domain-containing protein